MKVKEYKNKRQFERDAKKLEVEGLFPATVSNQSHKTGCLRLLLGGFLFRKAPTILVTYRGAE